MSRGTLLTLIFLVAWFLLLRFILPKMGVST
jgi:hypothetical protein